MSLLGSGPDAALHCLQPSQRLSWVPTAQNFLKLKHLVGIRGAPALQALVDFSSLTHSFKAFT